MISRMAFCVPEAAAPFNHELATRTRFPTGVLGSYGSFIMVSLAKRPEGKQDCFPSGHD